MENSFPAKHRSETASTLLATTMVLCPSFIINLDYRMLGPTVSGAWIETWRFTAYCALGRPRLASPFRMALLNVLRLQRADRLGAGSREPILGLPDVAPWQ